MPSHYERESESGVHALGKPIPCELMCVKGLWDHKAKSTTLDSESVDYQLALALGQCSVDPGLLLCVSATLSALPSSNVTFVLRPIFRSLRTWLSTPPLAPGDGGGSSQTLQQARTAVQHQCPLTTCPQGVYYVFLLQSTKLEGSILTGPARAT